MAIKSHNPTILSGVPRGGWAEFQKRRWCNRELGEDVPVAMCESKEKSTFCQPGDILIDDRRAAKFLWEQSGGVFIHHKSANLTIRKLKNIINSRCKVLLASSANSFSDVRKHSYNLRTTPSPPKTSQVHFTPQFSSRTSEEKLDIDGSDEVGSKVVRKGLILEDVCCMQEKEGVYHTDSNGDYDSNKAGDIGFVVCEDVYSCNRDGPETADFYTDMKNLNDLKIKNTAAERSDESEQYKLFDGFQETVNCLVALISFHLVAGAGNIFSQNNDFLLTFGTNDMVKTTVSLEFALKGLGWGEILKNDCTQVLYEQRFGSFDITKFPLFLDKIFGDKCFLWVRLVHLEFCLNRFKKRISMDDVEAYMSSSVVYRHMGDDNDDNNGGNNINNQNNNKNTNNDGNDSDDFNNLGNIKNNLNPDNANVTVMNNTEYQSNNTKQNTCNQTQNTNINIDEVGVSRNVHVFQCLKHIYAYHTACVWYDRVSGEVYFNLLVMIYLDNFFCTYN
jgi:hypothetical protein